MDMIKKETQDYRNRCSAEATKILEDIQLADREVGIMERDAAEVLKVKSRFLFLSLIVKLVVFEPNWGEKALVVVICIEYLNICLSLLSLLCFNELGG